MNVTIEERINLLEQQQALQTQALRDILEGHWDTLEGAAGVLETLTGIPVDARPFPDDSQ